MSGEKIIGGGLDLSKHLNKSAEQLAKEEIAKFNDEVNDLVIGVEGLLEKKDLTWAHFSSMVSAFNARNDIVLPQLKMGKLKEMFTSLTENQDVRPR